VVGAGPAILYIPQKYFGGQSHYRCRFRRLAGSLLRESAPTLDPITRIEHAEKFFAALGTTIRHGGNRAFYSISADAIQMPPFESFQADSYYGTLAHEATHWTGSKTRLDRDFGGHCR
jgi:antirestriction protein ArdC